ncbi:TetR/AcrR family transcriptional regulator [Brevundimonas subvibrioides]|uniref:Transcriptional regulator, TetR family n=1 Tax=Brevundimonas subvibrioides (strain ATCC 15264 / DSM 4735 / LMG 14903 / NBRC 16000 / CB 81) TaxID=633149 RepID=D9QLD4_BRESC|nr:TetR/AcrR family transcriptional regulator [Brevundimonas subvibrioides]ADL01828.1 transcriptional regulator, TetR family [Brevundimonas subvibrioides ATCC 15264]
MPELPTSSSAGPVKGARKPKGEGHARRAEILEAAERIFVEVGYEGATIRRIADEVGLSSTALYMHFSEKSEILHEICRVAFARLQAMNQAVMDEPGPPDDRLRRLLEAYVAFGFDNPNAYRLTYLTRPVEARDGAQTAAQSLGGELYRAFEAVVQDVAAEGHLRGEPRATAQTLWAGAHGVVSLMITKPYFDWVGREALTRSMIDALIAGLLKP